MYISSICISPGQHIGQSLNLTGSIVRVSKPDKDTKFYCDSVQKTLSCSPKYSLEQQMWINPLLKLDPNYKDEHQPYPLK